jgi:hypothetical protein
MNGENPVGRAAGENRQDGDDLFGENCAESGDDRQKDGHVPEDALGQCPSSPRGSVAHVACENRDERGAEGTLGRHAANQAGDPERKDESVGGGGSPEEENHPLIA